ncbi:hypothetical protein HD554DRAFT_2206187 [Boletus coccyginus]|nr:hypothetical protein HD554DRAFT_2206187 [Boletus coccyginus]
MSGDKLLCAFTTFKAGMVSTSTVQGFLATIKAWHILNNKLWLGSQCMCYILNGVANLAPPSSSKPACPPVSRSMLILLAQHLDLTSNLDICCFATVCSVALHSHLDPPFNANGSCICFLPFTKVLKSHDKLVVICHQTNASEPIEALDIHLHINPPPSNTPLFSFRVDASWHCLTR